MPQTAKAQLIAVRRQIIANSAVKRRKNRKIPDQRFPRKVQIHYAAALQKYQNTVNGIIRDLLYSQLETLVPPRIDHDVRFDQDEDDIDRIMARIRALIAARIDLEPDINESALATSEWQSREFQAQLAVAQGLPVTATIQPISIGATEPWLAQHLDDYLKSNINLITKMTETQLDDVETIVRSGRRRGLRVEVLRKQIAQQMGVSKSRAYLIARDQVNKLNGELNQRRQVDVGVEKYIWRTSDDERVRQRHRELDDTPQRWDDPPVIAPGYVTKEGKVVAPRTGHPGEDYQCRCYAEPVLDDLIPE